MQFTCHAPQVREYVDGVLNVLTHGAHAKTSLCSISSQPQTKGNCAIMLRSLLSIIKGTEKSENMYRSAALPWLSLSILP